ncbi:serine/threonine-protein kinase 16-like isoform 1, partial [Thraustotheca clavata]
MGNLKSIAVNGRSYEVCGKLGSGGFSEVYLVEDRRSKLKMALKVMVCQEDEQIQRALMEVQLHRRIDHPNVLRLLGSEIRLKAHNPRNEVEYSTTRSKEVLLLFPALTRGSLQDILNHSSLHKEPALSEIDCLQLFQGIVSGVREIHRLGLAHRDIKPANILLSDEFTPIVMDLGSVAPLNMMIQTHQDSMEMIEEAAQFSSAAYRAPELYDDCFRGQLSAA